MGKVTKGSAAITGAVCSVTLIINIVLSHGLLRTNREGLELIGNAEGCHRDPYTCPAGHITDGIGNTHNVIPGTRKTDEQIARDWEKNIGQAEECVNRYADGKSLSDNTFSAVTSIAFNVGCPTIRKSTLFTLLREGKITLACNQFPRWVYAGKTVLPGLVDRRGKEKVLCLKGAEE